MHSRLSYLITIDPRVHCSDLGGHFGIAKTPQQLQGKYFQPTIRQDTNQFIWECHTCQTTQRTTYKRRIVHPFAYSIRAIDRHLFGRDTLLQGNLCPCPPET